MFFDVHAPCSHGLVCVGTAGTAVKVQQDEWFPATVKEVKGSGFYFLSWDDGYSADRTKCAFELRLRRSVVVVAEGRGGGRESYHRGAGNCITTCKQ